MIMISKTGTMAPAGPLSVGAVDPPPGLPGPRVGRLSKVPPARGLTDGAGEELMGVPGTRVVGCPTAPPVGSNVIQPYVGKKTSTQACFC